MASSVHSSLEQVLAHTLLYSTGSPLDCVYSKLTHAHTPEQKQSVVQEFVENNLSLTDQILLAQDKERIHELFDKIIKNIAQQRLIKAADRRKTLEKISGGIENLSAASDSMNKIDRILKQRTWTGQATQKLESLADTAQKTIKPLLQNGVGMICNGLSTIGVISKPEQKPSEKGLLPPEENQEDEDWNLIGTEESQRRELTREQGKEICSIFKKWEENPALILEIEDVRKSIGTLKSLLNPLPKEEIPDSDIAFSLAEEATD